MEKIKTFEEFTKGKSTPQTTVNETVGEKEKQAQFHAGNKLTSQAAKDFIAGWEACEKHNKK